jgi:Protein of unknown function (DUF1194)
MPNRRAVLLAVAGLVAAGPLRAAEEVDVELVLAADGSGSIDDDELKLQRDGYADALASPEVLGAIARNAIGAIAVAYIEWGGPFSQHVIVDWHRISDHASAQAFGQKLRAAPRQARGYNSISAAIDVSVHLTETNSFQGLRKVIDVSGDGPHMGGRAVELARDEAVAKGFTINALAIQRPGGGFRGPGGLPLAEHYRQSVIGGPRSFVEIADGTRTFTDAVRVKLVLEIAETDRPPRSIGRI